MEVEAHNPNSLGRAYTCGLSNMGCYDASGVQADSRVSVKGIHFATVSQAIPIFHASTPSAHSNLPFEILESCSLGHLVSTELWYR
jgi:hypothetical protein